VYFYWFPSQLAIAYPPLDAFSAIGSLPIKIPHVTEPYSSWFWMAMYLKLGATVAL
jgi:hypothetical protein